MRAQYGRADRVVWRQASGGVLVLPVDGHEVVALTGTGEDVWEMLSEPHTIHALAQRLAEHYSAPESTIVGELAPVLDDLSRRGVLARADQP